MDDRCIAPNCDKTEGLPFPKIPSVAKKWLNALGIPNVVPTTGTFVCLDHIVNENDLNLGVQNASNKKPEEYNVFVGENDIICRLCMDKGLHLRFTNIFEKFNEKISIKTAITSCIPSIKIRHDDLLSKKICKRCLLSLRFFYTFQMHCQQTDSIQHQNNEPSPPIKKRKIRLETVAKLVKVEDIVKPNSDIDRKFDLIEAELRRVLADNMDDEELQAADIIIIHVESDHESDDQRPDNDNVVTDNKILMDSAALTLPKDIKVTKHCTQLVNFPAKIIKGLFDTEFCLVSHYLFQFRLNKASERHLSCLVSTCPVVGVQELLKPNVFQETVTLKNAHNHPPPTQDEMKKQMFYFVIKRKMQNDKTLNFREVYENICLSQPELKELLPLKNVINEICCEQSTSKIPTINSFQIFFDVIEADVFQRLHFTYNNKQFYQEKVAVEDGGRAVIFANSDVIQQLSNSKLMYVDASFKIDTTEEFTYCLLTVLVWIDDNSYYPIMFALVNQKTQAIFIEVFRYLHDKLAPDLAPQEIITDYDASIFYALKEVYIESDLCGSIFYYTQNLYKKICSLNLSKELETNSYFRNIYHMLLMLPLLPSNTIIDALNNIISQASDMGLSDLADPMFEHVKSQWIVRVTPSLFSVHKCENRINENVIAPFKKLRDFLMLSKGKMQKHRITIVSVVEKLIDLENFLQTTYAAPTKKSFARDLSCHQKKNVIRAWSFIENHPKININHFFTKVLGYIKCMENQLWIWGFYRYLGDASDELIEASNTTYFQFDVVEDNEEERIVVAAAATDSNNGYIEYYPGEEVVLDVVVDQTDGFLMNNQNYIGSEEIVQLQSNEVVEEVQNDDETQFQHAYLKYVTKK